MRYYIADNHFFHHNLLTRMDNRNFSSVEEMNAHMITQWNKKVRRNDEVVILGDLSFGNSQLTTDVIKSLNGRKYLIEGNHDHRYLKNRDFDKSLFGWIKGYTEMSDNKRKVVLCHYPILCYNGQYRKLEDGSPSVYMLHGHIHNSHDQDLIDRFTRETRETYAYSAHSKEAMPIPCNIINCFCMYSDYMPLTLDEWITLNEKRVAGEVEYKR